MRSAGPAECLQFFNSSGKKTSERSVYWLSPTMTAPSIDCRSLAYPEVSKALKTHMGKASVQVQNWESMGQ